MLSLSSYERSFKISLKNKCNSPAEFAGTLPLILTIFESVYANFAKWKISVTTLFTVSPGTAVIMYEPEYTGFTTSDEFGSAFLTGFTKIISPR